MEPQSCGGPAALPLTQIASFLPAGPLAQMRVCSAESRQELAPHVAATCAGLWEDVVEDSLARLHYREVLGASDAMLLLARRRWLCDVDEATKFSQWRTESPVARLMHGVRMDDGDLFSALRRAYLASQVPALAERPGVAEWMHVLGALEEQDPVQAVLLSGEAWRPLAAAMSEQTLLWAVEAFHFVDGLESLAEWLVGEGGMGGPELLTWLTALVQRLEREPTAGRYGPAGDTQQVRARHLAEPLRALQRSLEDK